MFEASRNKEPFGSQSKLKMENNPRVPGGAPRVLTGSAVGWVWVTSSPRLFPIARAQPCHRTPMPRSCWVFMVSLRGLGAEGWAGGN